MDESLVETTQSDVLAPLHVTANQVNIEIEQSDDLEPCSESILSERDVKADSYKEPRVIVSSGDCPAVTEDLLHSFVQAVHEKYNDDIATDAIKNIIMIPKSGPVKLTASGNIMLPRQVSMSGCEISVAGDPALIHRMCQKVRELDLMENNITNWQEVFSIIECIPQLTFLNLTKNQLSSSVPDPCSRVLPSLTHLVLNSTFISWDNLIQLLNIFPSLEELHLSLNGFESVQFPPSSIPPTSTRPTPGSTSTSSAVINYPSLQKLFFIGNKITDWGEINKLGEFFPSLTFFLISETDIRTLEDASRISQCFPNLQTLGLNRTLLESWEEVEKLRLFPSLYDVRLNGIPFLEALPEIFRRQHTISLLPNITHLNGSRIGETEREDAERAYIRLFLDKEEKTQRYHDLVRLHGKVDPLAKVTLKPKTRVHLMIRVENAKQEVVKLEELDVNMTQTVRELKKLVSNIAGCPASKLQLYYLDKQLDMGPDKLKFLDRKIFSYNMTDGDEIIAECQDLG